MAQHSSITVNGAPLKEYLGKEKAAEVAAIQAQEVKQKTWKRHIVTKHKLNGNGKTKRGTSLYRGDPKSTHILAYGVFAAVADKSPFVRSGESVYGGVEFCDATQEFKCHTCGGWAKGLGQHVAKTHRLAFKEYKLEHGLSTRRGIISPRNRDKLRSIANAKLKAGIMRPDLGGTVSSLHSARAAKSRMSQLAQAWGRGGGLSPELANLLGRCREQTQRDARVLYERLGKTPTVAQLTQFRNNNGQASLAYYRLVKMYGTVKNFFACCGIPSRGQGVRP